MCNIGFFQSVSTVCNSLIKVKQNWCYCSVTYFCWEARFYRLILKKCLPSLATCNWSQSCIFFLSFLKFNQTVSCSRKTKLLSIFCYTIYGNTNLLWKLNFCKLKSINTDNLVIAFQIKNYIWAKRLNGSWML